MNMPKMRSTYDKRVFNGALGVVTGISPEDGQLRVRLDEGSTDEHAGNETRALVGVIDIPVVAKPFDVDYFLGTISAASERLRQASVPQPALIPGHLQP